jgi:hypothetical protein
MDFLELSIYMVENSIKISNNIKKQDPIWIDCLSIIKNKCKDDPLIENYLDLNPENYFYFVSLIVDDNIISFGAIEKSPNKWGESLVRVLTRFWIHPDFRSNGFTKWGDHRPRFSPIILKNQLEFLETKKEIKAAMITREGNYLKSFKEIIRLANTVSKNPFEILKNRYNVCGSMEIVPESCKQFVAVSLLQNSTIENVLEMADLQTVE